MRRGLLYAGTQHGFYISYDDGDHWQPLSLNLPDVQVSDIWVEANSIAIATHGRSFYILDDVAPLRQRGHGDRRRRFHLFKPADAIRGAGAATISVPAAEAGGEDDDRDPRCEGRGRADDSRAAPGRTRRQGC